MKFAVSNLALPPFDHTRHLTRLTAAGAAGLEIAPFHTWPGGLVGLADGEMRTYRRAVELAGLSVVGLHAVLADPLSGRQIENAEWRAALAAELYELSARCRDLGGRTVVIGPRRLLGLSERACWALCRAFFEELLPRVADHGTVFCFAPLAADAGDFCATARECLMMADALNHPSFGLHLSAAALAARGAVPHALFAAMSDRLDLFHVDEPGGAPVGSTSAVDHADFQRHLAAVAYRGWLSLVQATGGDGKTFNRLSEAAARVKATYLPPIPLHVQGPWLSARP